MMYVLWAVKPDQRIPTANTQLTAVKEPITENVVSGKLP